MTAIPESLPGQPRRITAPRLFAIVSLMVAIVLLVPEGSVLVLGTFVYAPCAGMLAVRLWRRGEGGSPARVLLALPLAAFGIRLGCQLWPRADGYVFALVPMLIYVLLVIAGTSIHTRAARVTCWWIAGVAMGAFAGVGVSMLLVVPFVLTFPVLLAWGATRLARDEPNTTRELHALLALAIAWTVTWFGVTGNVLHMPSDAAAFRVWSARFGGDDPFRTLMVTGFPLRAIEGSGAGGAKEWLPWHKGLWCLFANFGICWTVAYAAIFPQRRSLRAFTVYLLLLPAGIAGLAGGWKVICMLD